MAFSLSDFISVEHLVSLLSPFTAILDRRSAAPAFQHIKNEFFSRCVDRNLSMTHDWVHNFHHSGNYNGNLILFKLVLGFDR